MPEAAVNSLYYQLVGVENLKLGMFVAELDRPWTESRFMYQGFRLTRHSEIEELQRLCDYVVIDSSRGNAATRLWSGPTRQDLELELNHMVGRAGGKPVYEDKTSVEEELQSAKDLHTLLLNEIGNLMEDARRGRDLRAQTLRDSLKGMIESMLRNPDAFLWLSRLKDKDSYTYAHAIDACSLAIAFGRHLGLSRTDLEHLGIGTLLFDIGKMNLPDELLHKPGKLTPQEFEHMKHHVQHSVDLMSGIKGIHPRSIEVARTHHERFNGRGYPNGLQGRDIPMMGRIAALVDCYDAITSKRPYAHALPQHEAILKLYEWRDVDFQAQLVEQFIQCLGVYPTGSLVELSSGEVGIVLSQNRLMRLRPRLLLILDGNKVAYGFSPIVDLLDHFTPEGDPVTILRPLEPDTYGIDPREYYL